MKHIALLSIAIVTSLQCFGWGQKGHDTTCAIAENHLTTKSKAKIEALLGGKSIVYYANWMDNASNTPQYAYSKTWHYRNVDEGQTFATAPRERAGDVERALYYHIERLKDKALPVDSASLYLKFVIHMMGDLHQPMHIGHKSDLGGNRHKVTYFNQQMNLHGLWDSQIVESAHKWGYSEWRDQVDRLTKAQIKDIEKGTITDWGEETFQICTQVYKDSPSSKKLSYDYVSKWTPTIEQQLVRGGIRLAMVLNQIFDK